MFWISILESQEYETLSEISYAIMSSTNWSKVIRIYF